MASRRSHAELESHSRRTGRDSPGRSLLRDQVLVRPLGQRPNDVPNGVLLPRDAARERSADEWWRADRRKVEFRCPESQEATKGGGSSSTTALSARQYHNRGFGAC